MNCQPLEKIYKTELFPNKIRADLIGHANCYYRLESASI